jgi:hypothetical protein
MAGIVHPGALMGLAYVLQEGHPKMTAKQAVDNAHQIIRGLHTMDLEIGPLVAFGPQQGTPVLDALDVAADLLAREAGREPWFPDGFDKERMR